MKQFEVKFQGKKQETVEQTKQVCVRTLGEILVVEKPKGILSIIPAHRRPEDHYYRNYIISDGLSRRAQQMCEEFGVKYLPVNVNVFLELTWNSLANSPFTKYFIDKAKEDFDAGLLIPGFSFGDSLFKQGIIALEAIFGEDRIHVTLPEENIDTNLENATEELYPILDVAKRLITL